MNNASVRNKSFLPVLGIYGANAAGKSNVLAALHFLIDSITDSYTHSLSRKKPMPYQPARIDVSERTAPSHFDVDVLIDGVRHHYGFEHDAEGVTREWLYSFPSNARKVLFMRDFSAGNAEQSVYFGPTIKRIDPTLSEQSKNRWCLFLSAASALNHEQLSAVAKYFEQHFDVFGAVKAANNRQLAMVLQDERSRQEIEAFLSRVDVGILGIKIEKKPAEKKMRDAVLGMGKALAEAFGNSMPIDAFAEIAEFDYDIRFVHRGKNEVSFELPTSAESSGTLHLLSILMPTIEAIKEGKVLVIDEITTSLHTMLSQELIKLFVTPEINTKGAQFIFTTHDTNLLSSGFLRRDEIWFAEKGHFGETHVYPLSDFHTRSSDNLERGYLQGRFGAIPFFGDVNSLFSAQ
ncbi:ATP-binding protein [Paraburkholderia sp.]|uniref:AAA family ATPase n=1 Tax=Paraburkholderia sp. TaxID=1926495 RepID=UPI002580E271|nr:ATP-binding protein [Paraburkholderia sp.]